MTKRATAPPQPPRPQEDAGRPLWPALIAAPALVLAEQSAAFALVGPLCNAQRGLWLHLLPLATLAVVVALTLMAAAEMRRLRPPPGQTGDADRRKFRRLFVARMATGCGALSALSLLTLWLPIALLSPCQQ